MDNDKEELPPLPPLPSTEVPSSCKRKRGKRGPEKGTKLNMTRTHNDWYQACKTFRELNCPNSNTSSSPSKDKKKKKKKTMSQTAFLQGDASGPKFSGTKSEQSSFGKYLRKYDAGQLRASETKRKKRAKYPDVEEKLIEYIHQQFQPDQCFKSWQFLQEKALEFANELGYPAGAFQASNGWIHNALKRGNKTGISLDFDDTDDDENGEEEGDNEGTKATTHNRQTSRLIATLVASQKLEEEQEARNGSTGTTSSLSENDDDDDNNEVDDDNAMLEAIVHQGNKIGGVARLPPPAPPAPPVWHCVCGEENEAVLNFCGMCGTAARWECNGCHYADNKCRFKFCGMCGVARGVNTLVFAPP